MGLIKTAASALSTTLADQYKEYFVCSSLSNDTLMVKGERKGKGSFLSGNSGSDNVITNGSGVVVADGQCVILTEQGKVYSVSSEPGVYTFDSKAEPSIFTSNLGDAFGNIVEQFKSRFTYGGEIPQDQRVYYINTKEIVDNKFGTPSPVSFRVVDARVNLDLDVTLRCNGIYSYRIANPIAFYENIAGNVTTSYDKSELDGQLKTEFISSLQPALAEIAKLGIRPSELPAHVEELTVAVNTVLSEKWTKLRGIEVVSIALNPITLSEEYEQIIRDAQKQAIYTDNNMAKGGLVEAQIQAMKDAANNPNGAMGGFVGLNMASGFGGSKATDFVAATSTSTPDAGWTCECGHSGNTGKFCSECGKPKKSSFCPECGKEVPAGSKFCPSCGKQL